MDLGLAGVACVVTGGSEGMGRAAAEALAREGARVAVVARTPATLHAAAEQVAAAGAADVLEVAADLVEPDAAAQVVETVVAAWGAPQVLVNTVGLCETNGGFLESDDGFWQRSFDSVLMAAVRMARAALPPMRAAGRGSIVNTCAMSVRHFLPVMTHYSAQKAALAHLTKNLAHEFVRDGIRTNAVIPGMIRSDAVARRREQLMAERDWDDAQFFDYVNAKYDNCTFSDRLGEPAEVGRVIAFLASPLTTYVNGALVPVDGGSAF